jgi:dGTPase
VPFLAGLLAEVDGRYPGLDLPRRIHELTRRVITRFVEDAVLESAGRLDALAPGHADEIRHAAGPVVAFSPALQAADRDIKAFLYPHMYRHPRVLAVRREADSIVRDLFRRFTAEPAAMPAEWSDSLVGAGEARIARRVADYIAGMTDGYAVLEHRRLFPVTPELRYVS